MANLYCEENSLAKILGLIPGSTRLSENAMVGNPAEEEIFGDQGGYPSILNECRFIHEGRRMIPEIHGEDFTQQHYQLEGSLIFGYEEA